MQKIWIIRATVLTLIVGVLVAALVPIERTRRRLSATLKENQSKISAAKTAGLYDMSTQEAQRLKQNFSLDEAAFLKPSQVAGLLEKISDLAEKNRVRVISLKPEAVSSAKGQKINRLPIQISLEGVYSAIGNFLQSLDEAGLIAVVDSYELKRLSGSNELSCRVVLTYFLKG